MLTADRVANSVWVDRTARVGLIARGVVYGGTGLIALQIARHGSQESSADKVGALREIAERPFGRALLVVLCIGLLGYIAWRVADATVGHRDADDEAERTGKRALAALKAVLYSILLVSAVRLVLRGPSAAGSPGDTKEESLTARLLALTGGRWIVATVGVALMLGGLYIVYRGLGQKFDDKLDTSEVGGVFGPIVDVLGTVGLAARGSVYALVGFVALKAAIDFDAEQANGFDGTLKLIAQQPYGEVLLTVTALGLMAFGLYSFAEARYRQL